MAPRSSALKINILGDYDSLRKAITKSVGQVDRLDKSVRKSNKTTFRDMGKAAFGAAAGLGAIAIAGNEVKKSVSQTIDLAKATRQLQRATGMASEDASQLAAVLKVRGMDTNKLGRSFTTLARQIEAAKTGTGGAADAFAKLGVSQKAIKSGNFNQVLLGIADGFKKLGDGTSKASVAQQLFGRNSRDLLPLLEGGSAKLREQLGLAPKLSDAQVKQSLAMVNAQRQVDLALMNVRTTLGTTLMPVLADGANKLAKFVTEMKTGKGAGGEFARKVKDIWTNVKPAVKQLVDFGKAVFNFAANNPEVVRIAASLAAVGLAIKGIKFVSAISGLTTFMNTAKGLGGPLKKLFARFGTRAGTAFAGEAAGNMAADMATSVGPSGRLGKMGGKKGMFGKWGGRMGRFAAGGFIAAFVAFFGENITRAIQGAMQRLKFPQWVIDHFGGFIAPPNAGRDRYGDSRQEFPAGPRYPGRNNQPRRRGGPTAKGSSFMGRASRALRPSLNPFKGSIYDLRGMDPLTGGIPLEALIQRAQGKQTKAQYAVDRFQAGIGDSRSKAETKRLKELTAAARQAQREVSKLQKQMARRDALLEVRSAFKDFAQGFVDAYSQGLQNIADARLNAAQNLADKALKAQLDNLDEEQGQSEEAKRIRELRNQQEIDQREREDQDYTDGRLALETQLSRAIANGNLRGQQDLQKQLDELDTQRRDTLRAREIQDLSESLQRQRNAAQSDYEARVGAAQEYYDKQLELNKQAVADYKAVVDKQYGDLVAMLEAGKISYGDFNTRVTELSGWLTGMLQGDLDNRATAERNSLSDSLTRYGTFVTDVNAEFGKVMRTLPVPEIPPIPTISIDAVLNIQSINGLPSGITTGGGSSSPARQSDDWVQSTLKTIIKRAKGGAIGVANLAKQWGWSEAELRALLKTKPFADLLKKYRVAARVSGGPLSRSALSMTTVGETGPELVMNGQVYSATKTAQMGGANGVTLNVYPQTTADDPVQLARALGWQLATR